jgi:hypothetical protein
MHNLTDHLKFIFPMKNYFSSQNLPMERALSGKATNDIDIVLYNAVSREKTSSDQRETPIRPR